MKIAIELAPRKFTVKKISGVDCATAYKFDESVHPKNAMQSKHLGGVITFPADLNTKPDVSILGTIVKSLRREIFHQDYFARLFGKKHDIAVVDYSSSEIFKGCYVNRESGEMYDSHSISLEINGLTSKELLALAKCILDERPREKELFVFDMNKNQHYLICSRDDSLTRKAKAVDAKAVGKISKFLDEYECVAVSRAKDSIENVSSETYSEIAKYAQGDEYKRLGLVPQMYRREWDRKLYGVAIMLRYSVAITKDAYVFVNVNHDPDFFKYIQRLASAFNQELVVAKNAGTQDAYRLNCRNVDQDAKSSCGKPIGPFASFIALDEIACHIFNPFGMPMSFVNENKQKDAIRLGLDSWDGCNHMGKWGVSMATKDIMNELGLQKPVKKQ